MIGTLQWYAFVSLLGVLWSPHIAKIFPRLPDKGYAISKVFALLFFTFLPWLLNNFIPTTPWFSKSALSLWLTISILSLLFLAFKQRNYSFNFKIVGVIEVIFFLTFIIFLGQHSYHPELFGGEKPMDMNILSYAFRYTGGVFEDPWFSGQKLHYYYFGHLIFSSIAKISGVHPHLSYSLSLATLISLMTVVSLSCFLYLTKNLKRSVLLSFILVWGSNLKTVIGFISKGRSFTYNDFWETTRVFKDGGFAEFPLWSFSFADLHPHVMSYPFALSSVLITIYGLAHCGREKLSWGFFLVSALFFGALLGINTWDFLSLTLVYSIFLILACVREGRISYIPKFFLIHLTGLILFSPMLFQLQSGKPLVLHFNTMATNDIFSYFLFLGQWILFFIIGVWLERDRRKEYMIVGFSFLVLVIFFENIVFMDRVNTIFKGMTTVYWCLGLFSLSLLAKAKRSFLVVISLLCVIPSSILLYTLIEKRHFGKGERTLEGHHYLKRVSNEDFQLIEWINRNIHGTPVILERYSKSFDYFSVRISSHTGLPTFLGWDGHVLIRGQKWSKIIERKQIIDKIYNGSDPFYSYQSLRENEIDYIVVGRSEREKYKNSSLAKFKQYRDLFIPLVKFGGTIFYEVKK